MTSPNTTGYDHIHSSLSADAESFEMAIATGEHPVTTSHQEQQSHSTPPGDPNEDPAQQPNASSRPQFLKEINVGGANIAAGPLLFRKNSAASAAVPPHPLPVPPPPAGSAPAAPVREAGTASASPRNASNYLLGIPYANGPELLRQACLSVTAGPGEIMVIDNSTEGIPYELKASVLRGPVPWTFSQSMNILFSAAVDAGKDCALFLHTDGEALPGALEKLLSTVQELEDNGQPWGVCFTHYDVLAAYNLQAWEAIGGWDTTFPSYFSDNDYYRRMRLAGYPSAEAGGDLVIHHGGSSTLRNDPALRFLNEMTFPTYLALYVRKWGGEPGHETFDTPYNAVGETER